MREPTDVAKIRAFMEGVARRATGAGRIYFAGGASALLVGWRESTVDIDIKLDPEPPGVFEAIAHLKNSIDANIELASPDQFVPPLPRWRERSAYIGRIGSIEFFHYDFSGQALAKLVRGSARDLNDIDAMVERRLVDAQALLSLVDAAQEAFLRYPALEFADVRARVVSLLERRTDD